MKDLKDFELLFKKKSIKKLGIFIQMIFFLYKKHGF